MKNKGFTLIELLAVIVILALIALIATPIILNIIDDSKKEAAKVSAQNYFNAVEQAIVTKNLKGQFNPSECTISNQTKELICEGEFDTVHCEGKTSCATANLEVKVDGAKPTSVTLKFQNGLIIDGTTITIGGSSLIKNNNKIEYEKEIIVGNFNSVCKIATDSTVKGYEIGAKYNCKVDPDKDRYTFYILSYNDKNGNIVRDETQADTVNLIMDSNIRKGGEAVKEVEPTDTQKGLVAWNSEIGQSTIVHGPITVMKFLYEATLDWTNVLPINFKYYDKEIQEMLGKEGGYLSFESTNGDASINGVSMEFEKLLRSRMPIYSEDPLKTELQFRTDDNLFLFEYLHGYSNPVNKVKDVYAYWSFSTDGDSNSPLTIHTSGSVSGCLVSTNTYAGVRPVITLEI